MQRLGRAVFIPNTWMTDRVAQMAGQMCALHENSSHLKLISYLMHLGNKCVDGDGDHALSFSAPSI